MKISKVIALIEVIIKWLGNAIIYEVVICSIADKRVAVYLDFSSFNVRRTSLSLGVSRYRTVYPYTVCFFRCLNRKYIFHDHMEWLKRLISSGEIGIPLLT